MEKKNRFGQEGLTGFRIIRKDGKEEDLEELVRRRLEERPDEEDDLDELLDREDW